MTNARNLLVAAAAAIVAAVAVGVVVGSVVGDPAPSPSASTHDAPAGSPRDSAGSRPGTTGPAGPGTAATTDSAGAESAPQSPGGSASSGTSETSASPSTGLPGLSEESAGPAPLPSWDDLPAETATARGRLVDGYPSGLLPTAPRATVLTSSVSPSGERVQVTLVARRGQAPDALLRFYRGRLADAGFAEDDPATVGGARAASFHLGDNRVVVTVDPGDAQTYSLLATFDIGGA